jgi:hypothetical protein
MLKNRIVKERNSTSIKYNIQRNNHQIVSNGKTINKLKRLHNRHQKSESKVQHSCFGRLNSPFSLLSLFYRGKEHGTLQVR